MYILNVISLYAFESFIYLVNHKLWCLDYAEFLAFSAHDEEIIQSCLYEEEGKLRKK